MRTSGESMRKCRKDSAMTLTNTSGGWAMIKDSEQWRRCYELGCDVSTEIERL